MFIWQAVKLMTPRSTKALALRDMTKMNKNAVNKQFYLPSAGTLRQSKSIYQCIHQSQSKKVISKVRTVQLCWFLDKSFCADTRWQCAAAVFYWMPARNRQRGTVATHAIHNPYSNWAQRIAFFLCVINQITWGSHFKIVLMVMPHEFSCFRRPSVSFNKKKKKVSLLYMWC